ncbi:MAG: TIGR04295 family B12-binding domain-containing radical SAM protein [Acidobacteriaceae bacterium]|nr:TIGR04295 family B12-binding domain-containing radical SAM protein [Acidobacteriaceae bacterium]
MRFALVNPPWSFEGSIYFGCRDPHLPLEYGYAKALLQSAGHEAEIIDGQLNCLDHAGIKARVAEFRPDFTVVTTAPSYLFWRCAPPEVRVPQLLVSELRDVGGTMVAVGPHASTTPRSTLRKLGVDVAVLGECEEILPRLAGDWNEVSSICYREGDEVRVQSSPHASNMSTLPALHWPADTIARHSHHHHRFDAAPAGPGAEMEFSRGCPYHCTFCAKDNFRDQYRRRPLPIVFEELDGLLAEGVEYVYFIDEIFLPNRDLLEGLAARKLKFGMQTRIDLWNTAMLDLLADAGCVSVEAGVESVTEEGRQKLDKKCRMSTEELAGRLIYAKQRIPFVQANLLEMEEDQPGEIEKFRQSVIERGVWANQPVPLFPYPGSPEYTRRWGAAGDDAWERAHQAYLDQFEEFSDIQEERPLPLVQLELSPHVR